MEPLVVRLSRWRFILLGLLMLPFALIGLLAMAEEGLEASVVGLGFLGFFGGLGGFALVKAIQHKPVITLSDVGIEDTRLKVGVIPWSEVERAYELPYLWQKNVQVLVRYPEQFKRKQSGLLRSMGEMNAAFGWQPFVLVTASTDTTAKTVVDYIYQQLLRQWPAPAPAEASVPTTALGGEGEY